MPSSIGRGRINSRAKGVAFEEKIARELRMVYDSLALTARLAELPLGKERSTLIKTSRVRRSDQGKGAMEPDLVVRGCPFWFELQHSTAADPIAKLEQAERDCEQADSGLWPVSITHLTGRRKRAVVVAMRGCTYQKIVEQLSGEALDGTLDDIVIEMDWEDMKRSILPALEAVNGAK